MPSSAATHGRAEAEVGKQHSVEIAVESPMVTGVRRVVRRYFPPESPPGLAYPVIREDKTAPEKDVHQHGST